MARTFQDYANEWYEIFAKPNVAQVTALTYKRQLDLHINPVIGAMELPQIRPIHLQAIFNRMGDSVKKETKNKVKNVLNQIFKMAVEEELLNRNPLDSMSLKIRGQQSEETEPYTIAQMRYFAAHLNDIPDPSDRAWLAISISLPLRSEEVLGLRWEDVDEEDCLIHIRNTVTHPTRSSPQFRAYTKTESSRRVLAISPILLNLLPERGNPKDFIIGGHRPLSYTSMRHMRLRIAKQIGFEGLITPRRFRTTVATDISAMTHDLKLVQHMLGHSTPQMTLKHYDKGRNKAIDATEAINACYGLE